MKQPLYKAIATTFNAWNSCVHASNKEWTEKHSERLESLVENNMPHGSGVDSGVKFDWNRSKDNKLVFTFGYHFMNENGYYDGWEDYTLVVTPSLQFDYELRFIGKNRNDIKDYFYDTFQECLSSEVE